jgi:hypothetical protein
MTWASNFPLFFTMSPRTSTTPDASAPLATRTRSRMPNVPNSGDLPHRRRRAVVDPPTPSPPSASLVPMTKRGPPIGQKKLPNHAAGESVSGGNGLDHHELAT